MFSAFSQFIFGSSSLFGSNHSRHGPAKGSSWKDKSLCFDLRLQELELDRGEQLIGCFFPIEDVKGNQDELGLLKITNLRLIWICCKKRRVNLSIGWRTVTLAYEQNLKDALGVATTSLFVMTKYESTKYEFVFNRRASASSMGQSADPSDETSPDDWNALRKFSHEKPTLISHLSPMYLDDPFEVVFKVWQAYRQTGLFRHCRSNVAHLLASGSQLQSGLKLSDVNRLPSEEIIEVFPDVVQSESRSIRYNGTLMLTNVRLIWIDESLPPRNLSIPYTRVVSIKMKQGDKIGVSTQDYLASSTQVQFKLQKAALSSAGGETRAIRLIFEQLQKFCALYKSKPRYGPESCEDSISFMSHLRPIEHYLESTPFDPSLVRVIENFGPAVEVRTGQHLPAEGQLDVGQPLKDQGKRSDQDDVDEVERELDRHSSKLMSYLNEQPINLDRALVYSRDLGLAVEQPANGVDLRRIWQIEI